MSKAKSKTAPFPSREQVLEFIRECGGGAGKREIVRAFGLDGRQGTRLTKLLRELRDEGLIGRRRGKAGKLPSVTVVEVTGTDMDGEVLARPVAWRGEGDPPVIYMAPERRGRPAPGAGDRLLARLAPAGGGTYHGRTLRRLPAAPAGVLGIYQRVGGEGRIRPAGSRARGDFIVAAAGSLGAGNGDLVRADVLPGRRLGLKTARVVERLASTDGPRSISLIAIHDHHIPTEFSKDALAQAAAAGPAPLDGRDDLRGVAFVTIDGADARDFDDAVWAEPDDDPQNPGGWRLIVAIADVAWYVRPGDPLDEAAYGRGNSVYFPDRVVPMLPAALSNGWCSLNPGEDRPCLAAHMRIDAMGVLLRHRFQRALMRSAARLTYTQAQAARDGAPDDVVKPLMASVIAPLYGAYAALAKGRKGRGVLELDMPERRVVLGEDGNVVRMETKPRLDSHRLIEELMIAANVAAAETLERLKQPCMYRIHDAPAAEKMEALRQFLDGLGLRLAKGQVTKPDHFNRILAKVRGGPDERMVNEIVLRSQAQAEYSPANIGHFGLALGRYCHFTSPIRRYADLLVHRALIGGLKLGQGGLKPVPGDDAGVGAHLSQTERRAVAAERGAVDRFTAAFLAERVGARFAARVNGVTRFGLFVTLDDIGGDGLVPLGTLPEDHYIHDADRHVLRGRRTKREYRLGDEVEVILAEAEPLTGGLILHLLSGQGKAGGKRRRAGAGTGRAAAKGGASRRRKISR
ncbi:MAG: ribonuclease R [Rhodospirillales bacterium]